MNERITREQLVEQSVTEYARDQLFNVRGYPADKIAIVEEFDYTQRGELEKTTIAMGFNFDSPAEGAELGSDLVERPYTIELAVMGKDFTWGKNLSQALKFALDRQETIPLLDIADPGMPEIDKLIVDGVSSDRAQVADPEPWQRFIWVVSLRIIDQYHALAV